MIRLSTVFLAASASTALAHPGPHPSSAPMESLWHLLTEPDHLAVAAVVLVGAALVWRRMRRRG